MGLWERFLNWLRSLFVSRQLEISIVGLQNAGKTTLVNLLVTGEFDEDTITTIGFNFRQVKKNGVRLRIWDLGGQPKFRQTWEKYCRNCECIVYVVDSADIGNIDVARVQMHKLLSWPSLQGIPLLVLGNKNDLEGALNEEELISSLSLTQVTSRTIACCSVSCLTKANINTALRYLTNLPTEL